MRSIVCSLCICIDCTSASMVPVFWGPIFTLYIFLHCLVLGYGWGLPKIDFKWYHGVPYNPPNTSEISIPTRIGDIGSNIQFYLPLNEENTPKRGRMHHFVINWSGIGLCSYWFFTSYISYFIILIMAIIIG